MSRLEKIEAMLKDSPEDTFLRYALAMELRGENQLDRSVGIFLELTKEDPPHVPAFFMAGQVLEMQDEIEDAKAILTQGISEAQKQNDLHAAGEMTQMLDSLD